MYSSSSLRSGLAAIAALLCLHCHAAQDVPPQVPVPGPNEILKTLLSGHPRLLATAADFARVKEQMATDPLLKKWHAALLKSAEKVLADPPSKYEIPDGKRLLATSRRVLDRVELLAFLYQVDGD